MAEVSTATIAEVDASTESSPVQTESSPVQTDCVMDCSFEFTTSRVFSSRNELCQWTRDEGKRLGFVIIIAKSDGLGGNKKARIHFGCERGGQPRFKIKRETEKCRKSSGSKKCGCPFYLKGQQLSVHGDEWTLKVICGVHNHPATEYSVGHHSYAGRLSANEKSALIEMSKCQVRPKDILTSLKEKDPKNVSTMKTIYNARQRHRVIEQGGRLQVQHLLSKVAEYKYIEWHRSCEHNGSVTDLFWAHPVGVELLRAFPGIILMDCTYKTNKCNYPLLEIVGVTSTNMSFTVAFAFLEREEEDNYAWAMDKLRGLFINNVEPYIIVTDREFALINAIESTFPSTKHLLCRLHIDKDVLTNCRKMFEQESEWEKFYSSWKVVILSNTMEEYNAHSYALKNEFRSYPDALQYVMSTWLDPYKEKFVAYWTNMYRHRDNVTSNRAESAHFRLVRQLRANQGNFEKCWTNVHSLLELQHKEIKASFEKSLTGIHCNFILPEFRELRGIISIYALNLILSELKRSASVGVDPVACGCVVRRTHNLPCAHEISMLKRGDWSIPLECIDHHWRKLDMLPIPAAVVEGISNQRDTEVFLNWQRHHPATNGWDTPYLERTEDSVTDGFHTGNN